MVSLDDKRLQHAFLEEVSELLDNLNKQLLALEDDPTDKSVINEIFRMTHSVKSESALIGFKNISTIAHKMEDIFEKVRRGALIVDKKAMDALFAAFDRMMQLVAAIQNDQNEGAFEIIDVVNPLLEVLNEKPMEAKSNQAPKEEKKEEHSDDTNDESFATKLVVSTGVLKELKNVKFSDMEKTQIEDGLASGETFYKIIYHLQDDCDMRYPRAYLVYNNFLNAGTVVKTIPDIQMETEDEKFKEVELFLVSKTERDRLIECAEVDQVDKMSLLNIDEKSLHEILGMNITTLSNEDINKAEDIEKEWMKQFEESKKVEETPKEDNIISGKLETNATEEKDQKVEKEDKNEKKTISSNAAGAGAGKELQKQTIRVDIERLDILMNLVGELIINRSRFIQIKDKINEQISMQEIKTDLEDATNELERITDQMQMGMMQARMVPIGNVFSKFPRLVRDLANQVHKNVNLEIVGETTEIDRTVIELIADPLTHLIRNSIDHGLETPDEREKTGKSREGNVLLKAFQEGSSIYIEVSDDGKGINAEAVKEKAIEKGLISIQQSNSMAQMELLNLIFEPGFSTKKEVTSLSGRGVGMDVVRTQIEKLRGRVDIHTVQGEGTKFTIILPLTLTIVEALLVNVQRNIFAIPISVVEETIKVKKN
ncbi:MAG TPA: chemotaxis protein CheA, partial [Spirochaetota bacterium]|nr:chemotaxis protein CheA [Spirochaetota bacterium]